MFNGNAEDSSGNNNHGIVNGAELITDRAGNKDNAFLFYERPHRIKIPLTQSNTFSSGSFTASFWVKTLDESSASRGLLSNDANKTPLWGFKYTSVGTVRFIVRNQEGDSSSIFYPINDGKWHHITGTRNAYNNTMSLYVDSALVETKSAVTGSVNSLGDLWVGDHRNMLFIGRIDDVMLWDKPFTEKQLENFHAESAVVPQVASSSSDENSSPDPVGEYLFNGNADDSSAENNDGIVNAAHLSPDRHGSENSSYCFSERNNRIKIPLISANTFSDNSFTVSFWFKINESTSGMHGLITNSKNTIPVWSFSYSDSGKISFRIRNKEKQSSGILYPISDQNWHKITGIRNALNNTISLYVDSHHVETKSGIDGDVNSGNSIWIGEHTNRLFKGCIDDVVLWRKAFSADEMNQNVQYVDPTKNVKIIKTLDKQHKLPKY